MVKQEYDEYAEAKQWIKRGLGGIFAVFVLIALLTSIEIVNTGEVGVLLQFGEMKDVLYPGLHIVIPFISNVEMLSVQTMKYEIPASAASSDLQVVSTNIAVNYRIKDDKASVMQLYQQFRGDHETRIIAPLVQESVKANTAKFNVNDLIQKRELAKQAISGTLKDRLALYGIEVEEVSITNFDFSKVFNEAIEAKMVVEQEKLKAQLELEKKQIEVQKLIAEQNATAISQVIQAEADRQSSILRAEGEANATLTRAGATQKAVGMIQAVLSDQYIQYQYSQRWNGELPYFMGGDTGLLLNMGMEKNTDPTKGVVYPVTVNTG
jgi:prohibitin 2